MFSIIKNYKLNELVKIFEENNQGYVFDKASIHNKDFIKYVCVENYVPIGYLVLYTKNDFPIKDDFAVKIPIPENSVYIWHIIAKLGEENRGIGKKLIKYIQKKYKENYIFSIVDITNEKSIHLHNKLGFCVVDSFKRESNGIIHHYELFMFH